MPLISRPLRRWGSRSVGSSQAPSHRLLCGRSRPLYTGDDNRDSLEDEVKGWAECLQCRKRSVTALPSLFAPNREWLVSEPQEWRPGPRGQPCTPRMAGQCVWRQEGRGAALRSSFSLCPISELQLGAQKCPPAPKAL